MSVMGQERTLAALDFMSAIGGKADEKGSKADIKLLMSVFLLIMSALHPLTDIIRVGVFVRL